MALQRYFLRTAIAVAAGFVVAAASPAAAQQTTYRINGTVICSGTENNPIPVPGVTVAAIDSTFEIATTVTDANGFYSFTHVTDRPRSCVVWLPNQPLAPNGDTTALPTPPARITTLAEFNITSFFLPGRVDATMPETIYLGKDTNATDFFDNDFAVNCPVTTVVDGHVFCKDSEGPTVFLEGVTVAVINRDFVIETTVTDANGYYRFEHTSFESRDCIIWLPQQPLVTPGMTWPFPSPPAIVTNIGLSNLGPLFQPGRIDAELGETIFVGKNFGTTIFLDNDFSVPCPPCNPPVLEPIADQIAVEGDLFTSPLPVVTSGTTPITWILQSGPIGMTIDPMTGIVSWMAAFDSAPSVAVTIIADNGCPDEVTSQVTFNVFECIPPVIAPLPDVDLAEGEPFTSVQPVLTQGSGTIVFELIQGPLGMTIDPATGIVMWTATFEDIGAQEVIIIRAVNGCPDQGGFVSSQTFTITECTPPVIAPLPDVVLVEGESFTSVTPTLIQGSGTIVFELAQGPAGMTINPVTGVLSWTATFPDPTEPISIIIRAVNGCPDQGGFSSSQTFTITECTPPVIAPLPDVELIEGEVFTGVEPTLIQGSGTIVFELAQGPAGMTIDPATGIVSWTATFPDPTEPISIIIRAVNDCPDQGGFVSSQTFTITECIPPVIAPLPDVDLAEGEPFTSVQPVLTQGSGTITFELVQGPAGMTINPATGVVMWTATFGDVGAQEIIIIRAVNGCPDEGGFVSSQTFTVTECTPPVIAPLSDVELIEGEMFTSAQPTLTQGSGSITFELVEGPAGMTIDPVTGIVSWTAAFADPTEPISIIIRAVNGCPDQGGFISTQTFIITECTAPVVDPIDDDFAFEDTPYTGPVPQLSPETTQPATWEIVMGPTGMTVDPATGQVSWPMPVVESAPAMVVLRVTNSCGSAEVGFNIFDGNCVYTTEKDENYSQLGEAGVVDFLRGVLAGEGSVFVEQGRGLCMQVPELGDNITFWSSPHQCVPLKDRTVYRACIEASFDRPDPDINTIPLWTFWYDNWDPCDLGNIYGGEHWFADVMGGASGIDRAQGRSKFEVWFSPIPVETDQWRGTIEEDVINAFHPSVDNLNDFRYGFKIVDIGSGNMGANLDFGTICIESIKIQSLPIDCLKLDATLYDVPISPETHAASAIGETPLFAEIGTDGVARFNLSNGDDRTTLFPLAQTEERAEIFPALNVIGLYPVLWESDTLYRVRTDIQSGANSGETDPIDAILVNYDTVTNEQGGMHWAVRGMPASPGFQDNFFRAGSPRDAAITDGPQTYTQFFYSNNTTADPRIGADRLRGFVQLINRTDLYTEQSGTDPLEIHSLAVDRMIAPPQMPSGVSVSGN